MFLARRADCCKFHCAVNPSHSMRSTLRLGNPPRSPTCRTSFPEPKLAPWRVLLETSTKVDPRYDGTDWKGGVACTCIDKFLSTRNDMYSAPVRVQERFTIHIYNNMGLRQTAPPQSRVYAPVNGSFGRFCPPRRAPRDLPPSPPGYRSGHMMSMHRQSDCEYSQRPSQPQRSCHSQGVTPSQHGRQC